MKPRGHAQGNDLAHYWWPTDSIWVISLFGSPSLEAAKRLTDLFEENLSEACSHSTLFDVRALRAVSPAPLAHLAAWFLEYREQLDTYVQRVAVLHLDALSQALARGLEAMSGTAMPVELFDEPSAAFSWLGAPRPDELSGDFARLLEEHQSVLPALREVLRETPRASLSEASQRIGVSPRQLQRILQTRASTYRHERTLIRIELAKRLLMETNINIESIALDVGYSTLQNFVDAFRKETGQTPAAWRTRQSKERAPLANIED